MGIKLPFILLCSLTLLFCLSVYADQQKRTARLALPVFPALPPRPDQLVLAHIKKAKSTNNVQAEGPISSESKVTPITEEDSNSVVVGDAPTEKIHRRRLRRGAKHEADIQDQNTPYGQLQRNNADPTHYYPYPRFQGNDQGYPSPNQGYPNQGYPNQAYPQYEPSQYDQQNPGAVGIGMPPHSYPNSKHKYNSNSPSQRDWRKHAYRFREARTRSLQKDRNDGPMDNVAGALSDISASYAPWTPPDGPSSLGAMGGIGGMGSMGGIGGMGSMGGVGSMGSMGGVGGMGSIGSVGDMGMGATPALPVNPYAAGLYPSSNINELEASSPFSANVANPVPVSQTQGIPWPEGVDRPSSYYLPPDIMV